MEKLETEIKNNYAESSSGGVAVLEGEENKEETGRKITALAEEYLSFNNNEIKLEKDLNDMLEKINYLDRTSQSSEFLKGQLCLELYDIYKNSDKKEKMFWRMFFWSKLKKAFWNLPKAKILR